MNKRYKGNADDVRHMFKPLNKREQFHCFASVEAFAKHVKGTPEGWHDSAHESGNKDWRGTETMAEAINLAVNGWREGADKAAKLREKISALKPSARRLIKYSVAGATPNIPRYLAGNPMHMRTYDTVKSRQRPVITLVSDIGANNNVEGETFLNRAAVIAAIVDVIEDSGYSCHVIGYFGTKAKAFGERVHARVHARCAVTIKEPDQPVDIGRMAFALGHAAVFRRLGFAVMTEDRFTEDLGFGIGTTHSLEKDMLAMDNAFILPSVKEHTVEAKFKSEPHAMTVGLDYMIESLTEQGCPAFAG
jgi:hypothetical protein